MSRRLALAFLRPPRLSAQPFPSVPTDPHPPFLDVRSPDLLGCAHSLLSPAWVTPAVSKRMSPFPWENHGAFSGLFELASVSLACRDQDTLLKTFVARVGATLGARAVFVWTNGSSSKGAEGLTAACAGTSRANVLLPSAKPSAKACLQTSTNPPNPPRQQQDHRRRFRASRRTQSRPRQSAIVVSLPGAQRAEGVVEVQQARGRIHCRRRAFSRRSQSPRRFRAHQSRSH